MYEEQFLKALGLTVATETAVLFVVVRYFFSAGKTAVSNRLILFSGFVASGLTLPYVWFVLPAFIKSHWLYVATSEVSVTLVEAVLYWFVLTLNIRRCVALSLVANMCSFLLGLVVFR